MSNDIKIMKETYTVYLHTFPNGKVYIGITMQSATRRWRYDGSGYKTQSLIYSAIKKYGWENIRHEVLFTDLSKAEAEAMEIELIAKYKSNQRKHGYNVNNGGCHNGCCSQETKRKISIAKLGTHHSDEAKKKISDASRGRRHAEETKKKRSKPIFCVELNVVYFGIREAERVLNLANGCISKCLKGERKTAGGFHWKYANY